MQEPPKIISAWYDHNPGTRHWSLDNRSALCGLKIQPDWDEIPHASTIVWCRLCNELKAEIANRDARKRVQTQRA